MHLTQFKDNDIIFMQEALLEAEKAFNKDEVPVGSIIVDEKGNILSKGYNLVEKNNCQINHAEVIAVKNACEKIGDWRLSNCTIYVTLEPCAMCMNLILLSRISRVVYGLRSKIYGYSIDKYNTFELYKSPILIQEGVCMQESLNLLKLFFKNKRNKKQHE